MRITLIILFVLFGFACGTDAEEKTNNKRDFTDTGSDVDVADGDGTSNLNDETEMPIICVNRADCERNQECRASVCVTHLSCASRGGGTDADRCDESWAGCVDGREYDVKCIHDGNMTNCTCLINGVEEGSFTNTIADTCGNNLARLANENCNFLVPNN